MYYYYPLFTRGIHEGCFHVWRNKKKIKVFTLRLDKAQLESLAYGDYTWGLSRRQSFRILVCVCVIMLLTMK